MSRIAVVIPCYRCSRHIMDVIGRIPLGVDRIFVVDDACPEKTGEFVQCESNDPRVLVLKNHTNQGVGGAVITGYRAALKEGYDIVVKIDGDGQMDASKLANFTNLLLTKRADYAKGNRFFQLDLLSGMPFLRIIGNSFLSFMSKISTGYWHVMDPHNGYTAIHRTALKALPLDKLDKGFFFETDVLFHLNLIQAVVVDIPLPATYANEVSNLKITKILFSFLFKHINRCIKRFFITYVLRDFSIGTIELIFGVLFFLFGTVYGGYFWMRSIREGILATSGTVMLSGISVILGIQLILAAAFFDISRRYAIPLQELERE